MCIHIILCQITDSSVYTLYYVGCSSTSLDAASSVIASQAGNHSGCTGTVTLISVVGVSLSELSPSRPGYTVHGVSKLNLWVTNSSEQLRVLMSGVL